jgi:putative ABC transport system substrate-binding protein
MIRRRDFTIGLLCATASWGASAQEPPRPKRIAVVNPVTPAILLTEAAAERGWRTFFRELRRTGWVEGRNLEIERYSAEGHLKRYPRLVRQVVHSKPEVIVAATNILVSALASETKTIPMVVAVSDPVGWGLITNLARPGGNVTGVSSDPGIEILGKAVEILKEVIPSISKVAYLALPAAWDGASGQELRKAGERLGVSVVAMPIREARPSEFERLFAETTLERPDAIVASGTQYVAAYRQLVINLAAKYRIPTIYPYRGFAEDGGLMAYGASLDEMMMHLAGAVHSVLSGTRPGDIPFYQPTKYELVINLKAANALGLTIPQSLIARADEVLK